jgi:RHS repeat-associated protein
MLPLAERVSEPRSPAALPLADAFGPVVMADDPCLAAFSSSAAEPANQYYRARYYSPQLGRFVSEDPSGLRGGTNNYAYVENAPFRSTDPLGLAPGDPFKTADEAAMDAFQYVAGYERWKWEWGGRVCKCKDKDRYFCTGPKTNQVGTHVDVQRCPSGSENAGFWHTHPDDFSFSDADMNISYREGKPGYVLLLNGNVDKYLWQQGYPKTIGKVTMAKAPK